MNYLVWIAQQINEQRDSGYIPANDLFYEKEVHKTGSSQRHSIEVLTEFERIATFAENIDTTQTRPHLSEDLPIQQVK